MKNPDRKPYVYWMLAGFGAIVDGKANGIAYDTFDGKVIKATAGDGITYDAENNYYVIPQGSAVTETFTNGTVKEYTFNNQAGGIGGFNYAEL